MNRTRRTALLKNALDERILVLDGAMGTSIFTRNLSASDFGGAQFEGCNEYLNLAKPHVIREIHQSYLEVGADIIETNTFGGSALVLREYGLESQTLEINERAALIATEIAHKFSTALRTRFVAGSMGPTTKAISVTGGVTFEELIHHYFEQAKGLFIGGCDFFLIETAQDTRNVKAASIAIHRVFEEFDETIPIAISGTIESTGTMLGGQTVDAFWASIEHLDPLYVGLNCATGPEFMTDHIRTLASIATVPIGCVPNAGLPDEDGHYLETPLTMANTLKRFLDRGWLNVIGGCCGTGPHHIQAFAQLASNYKPRKLESPSLPMVSGIDPVYFSNDAKPILVGERTNVVGSRKFKELIWANDFDAAAEVGRGQVKSGAQIIDICLADPDRDEIADTRAFYDVASKKIRAPWMIDSTQTSVVGEALTYSQGKAIINSINLEDGERRFFEVAPLVRQFGAMVVVGTIDDNPSQGMAISKERKLEVAKRSYELLTKKYGLHPTEIIWDPLTFPCATGDAQYLGSAKETLSAISELKVLYPSTHTILGISNVSFGLPEAGRHVLNSIFLYHATKAGLDLAIVNTQQLSRYASIPENEKMLAEALLFSGDRKHIEAFTNHFRKKKISMKPTADALLPLNDRLTKCVIEGSKEGLEKDLKLALQDTDPLAIINGPLMKGMDEVGKLFAQNELIVAEVLQSAEVMKAAVSFLKPHMKLASQATRGKILLATVKGDVHDIGKNLVEIVLANNGFEVVNLGIKIAPEELISAIRTHHPNIIGLSGLLVKSAEQMVATADDLSKANISIPMLVGGAALSRNFVDRKIAKAYAGFVSYASDAMNGLELAKIVMNPAELQKLEQKLSLTRAELQQKSVAIPHEPLEKQVRSTISPLSEPNRSDNFDRHVITNTPLDEIWTFINLRMLYGRHLGLPNSKTKYLEERDFIGLQELDPEGKTRQLYETVEELKHWCRTNSILRPKAIYQFFKARSENESILVADRPFFFPRQSRAPHLCISDYVSADRNTEDSVSLFIVTAGYGVRERAQEFKDRGEYLKSHILSALALETAEAYAEWLHAKIRGLWGFPDPTSVSMMDRFQAKYRGKRYSFGYPACPELEQQKLLFELLKPEEIGVSLTDQFMMDPEASVSALVIQHPEALYFSM